MEATPEAEVEGFHLEVADYRRAAVVEGCRVDKRLPGAAGSHLRVLRLTRADCPAHHRDAARSKKFRLADNCHRKPPDNIRVAITPVVGGVGCSTRAVALLRLHRATVSTPHRTVEVVATRAGEAAEGEGAAVVVMEGVGDVAGEGVAAVVETPVRTCSTCWPSFPATAADRFLRCPARSANYSGAPVLGRSLATC